MLLALVAAVAAIGGGAGHVAQPALSRTTQDPLAESRAGYLRPRVLLTTIPGSLVGDQAEATALMEPAPSPEAAPQPTPEPTPEPRPAFFTHTIQPGDTVSSIAAAYGIDLQYILWNNLEVRDDPDFLLVGKDLLIPSVNGIRYEVRLGDTLSDIAAYYQIDVPGIVAFNNLPSADSIGENAVLLLPGAVPPPPPIPAAVAAVVATAPLPEPTPAATPPPRPAPSIGYIWPWYGNITTYFSGAHPGIDIDGFGNYGAPVVAAASGQVILVAWDTYSYGYHVIIRHDDGSQTLYAHFSDIYVAQGQYVGQGETIGALGSTGYSTGTHLHFELSIGGAKVDPLAYLP